MSFSNLLQIILNQLPTYIIEVGVFEDKTKRKDSKLQLNLTNAEIMFINENGSPLRNVPARPVLQMTIDWANKELIEKTKTDMIKKYLETGSIDELDKIVKKLCLKLQNHARQIIYSNDGTLAPNAPSTIKRKGENHPLFDTGQLARSITCSYTKI